MREEMLGLVGKGYWGSKIHRVLCEMEEFPYVCEPSYEHHIELQRILDMPQVRGMIIATPADTHFDLALKCLRAGKHVFVEKPMTLDSRQAQELVSLAKKKDLKLMVGHTFLYSSAVEFLKSHMCALGTLRYMYSRRCNLGIVRQDADTLWTFGPHDVSIGMHLMGKPPTEVQCTNMRLLGGRADVSLLQLRYGDVRQISHLSWLDPRKAREWVLVGDKAMVVWDDVHEPYIRVYQHHIDCPEGPDFATFVAHTRPGPMIAPVLPSWEPLKREMQEFLSAVRENKPILSDGESGLAIVKVLERAQESAMRKGARVSCKN